MPQSRRQYIATIAGGVTVGLTGCAGEWTPSGTAFSAQTAALPDDVQGVTGYSHYRTRDETIMHQVTRFGVTFDVNVTNVIGEYDQGIELGILGGRLQAAVFATLSTPQVSILGRAFNPIDDMESTEIAEEIQHRYESITDLQEDGRFTASVGGQSTPVTRFTETAQLIETGGQIRIYVYISQPVELGEDFVVTLAAHPYAFGQQAGIVRQLMAGVIHA